MIHGLRYALVADSRIAPFSYIERQRIIVKQNIDLHTCCALS